MRAITLDESDNVAVVVQNVKKGETVEVGCLKITAAEAIPQAHKIALSRINGGEAVIRYGTVLGYVKKTLETGDLVNETMLELPEPPPLDSMTDKAATNILRPQPVPSVTVFEGYRVAGYEYAGTRNILGINTTVQCVTGVVNIAVEKIRRELLPKYPHVDDVVAVNHDYGCGVAIDAAEAFYPIRALQNIARHPNFGGELMIVSLGCEKLSPETLAAGSIPDDCLIVLQEQNGFQAMIAAIYAMAQRKLERLEKRRRESLPLSMFCVGMQCGGSDAFSGVTANPAAGYASDMLVAAGATVMFSEVTEVRDGAHLLAERCLDKTVCEKLAKELQWYDEYLKTANVDRSSNPAPGNKKGGLSTIVEKAMGSIAKSGTAPISDVISAGELPHKKGLLFAATSASDFVCGTMQTASGITLQVFITGRGTPYGLAMLPVIKVCTRSDLKTMWNDIIDVDAGTILTGSKSVEDVGHEIFNLIIDCASGKKRPFAEQYRLHNDLTLFNPAPIT